MPVTTMPYYPANPSMKGTSNTSRIPDHSLLKELAPQFDYVDCYLGAFYDREEAIDITTVGRLFLGSGSKWVEGLFAIRNKVAGLLGLRTPENLKNRHQLLEACTFQPGQRLGLFTVFEKNEQELILGEDDKHLNFRVSLLLENLLDGTGKKKISITTAVTFNNRFGRFYFMLVRPFHKIIVKTMLKGMVARIESPKQLLAKQV
jgi:hypothetical protein